MASHSIEIQGKEISTIEDLIDLTGTSIKWSCWILSLYSFVGMLTTFQALTYQFLGRTPDHWCLVEPLIEANWTQEQIISLAIPVDDETGKRDSCNLYDYNYTLAAELGYSATIKDPQLISSGNATSVSCSERFFNSSDDATTVVTQWDLVCERRPLYSTVQGVVSAGYLLGSLIFGSLIDVFLIHKTILICLLLGSMLSYFICLRDFTLITDKSRLYGRRPTTLSCLALTFLFKVLALFSPNVIFYIVVRGTSSLFLMGAYMANFLNAMESCAPRLRSTVSALFIMPWCIGYMIMPGIAYGVQDWKWLHSVLALPYLVCLIYYWLLPESPRWLLLNGRHREALEVLKRAARINGQSLPSEEKMFSAMNVVVQHETSATENEHQKDWKSQTIHVVRSSFNLIIHKLYRARMLYLLFGWFSCAVIYYGIALSATNLSANVYLYMFLGGLSELPVYLLLWLWLNFRGRKFLMVGLFLNCAVCIAALTAIMVFLPNVSVAVTTLLSLCGKFSITAAFHLIWIYTAELFPTEYRSQALGQGNVIGRAGGICAPYINDLLGEVASWSPALMYALLSVVAAGVTLLLPDSSKDSLTETKALEKDKSTDEE